MLRGGFNYFKQAHPLVHELMDGFIRRRLRAILRKQEKRAGIGRRDHRQHCGHAAAGALIGGPVGLIAGALIGDHLMGQEKTAGASVSDRPELERVGAFATRKRASQRRAH